MQFLYQFKDDNKFYKLNEEVLKSEENNFFSIIYNLRSDALIGTDCELYTTPEGKYVADEFNYSSEIKAKILPKGIAMVETLLKKERIN